MPRMTTQQRLDCLLKMFDELSEEQGTGIELEAQDIDLIMKQCGFNSRKEIAFYINSLGLRKLVDSSCTPDGKILAAKITIDGYCYLDELR